MLEPASLSKMSAGTRTRLGLDSCFTQDASGYGNYLTPVGTAQVGRDSPAHSSSCDFAGTGYLKKENIALNAD
jgi:hypothetical protein